MTRVLERRNVAPMEANENDTSSTRKRQTSGVCAECRTAIPKSRRYCRKCGDLAAERKRRAAEGYVVIGTPTGPVELKLPRVSISETLVFNTHLFGHVAWSEMTPCGEILDVVLQILRSEPAYIAERDARRHMALICHLKSHRAKVWERGVRIEESVEALPLRHLDRALESWVRSWFSEPHSLLSCFALDTAEVILAHVHGFEGYGDTRTPWEIAPLLPEDLRAVVGRRESFRHEPRFKSELTSAIRDTLVIAKVPPRGRCTDRADREALLRAGDEFIVALVRCHLSMSFHDWVALNAVDEDEPEFSLSRAFEIPCEFRARHPGGVAPLELPDTQERSYPIPLKVPGRWLTHVLRRDSWKEPWVPVPLPEWLVA